MNVKKTRIHEVIRKITNINQIKSINRVYKQRLTKLNEWFLEKIDANYVK